MNKQESGGYLSMCMLAAGALLGQRQCSDGYPADYMYSWVDWRRIVGWAGVTHGCYNLQACSQRHCWGKWEFEAAGTLGSEVAGMLVVVIG